MPYSFHIILIVLLTTLLNTSLTYPTNSNVQKDPLRVGVVGLVHTHVHWILGREKRGDIEIVGIVEPNRDLAMQYSKQHGYSMDIVYDSIEEMVEKSNPEAVTAFNTIRDHLEVVEYCAPRGIHVMVEKPLAVSLDHAQKMIALAKEHDIHLLTNYETTWYGSNKIAYEMIHDKQAIGEIRRIVFQTGHPGPIEIGCNPEFLEWLTDPYYNGGGALTDFGCYGANLATWLMSGQEPISVSCITQNIKPHLYPNVEDEATIVLTYPKTQVLIQASWNWSHNLKEMHVYGKNGYILCLDGTEMEIQIDEEEGAKPMNAKPLAKGVDDPFAYLAQVVRSEFKEAPFNLSSMENNIIVMKILELAKTSAVTGKVMKWETVYGSDGQD